MLFICMHINLHAATKHINQKMGSHIMLDTVFSFNSRFIFSGNKSNITRSVMTITLFQRPRILGLAYKKTIGG